MDLGVHLVGVGEGLAVCVCVRVGLEVAVDKEEADGEDVKRALEVGVVAALKGLHPATIKKKTSKEKSVWDGFKCFFMPLLVFSAIPYPKVRI